MAEADPRPVMRTLDGCTVEIIEEHEARPLILKYEWLGTTGLPALCVGLRDPDGELIGATLFGHPGSPEAGNICGEDIPSLCLSRGCCTHWAHPHAASYLISRAVKLADVDIVFAYADPEAGEIGAAYQSCNWLYLGQGVGRGASPGAPRSELIDPSGRRYSTRALRHLGLTIREAQELGWRTVKTLPKHLYVTFNGDRRRRKELRGLLRFPVLAYPKR